MSQFRFAPNGGDPAYMVERTSMGTGALGVSNPSLSHGMTMTPQEARFAPLASGYKMSGIDNRDVDFFLRGDADRNKKIVITQMAAAAIAMNEMTAILNRFAPFEPWQGYKEIITEELIAEPPLLDRAPELAPARSFVKSFHSFGQTVERFNVKYDMEQGFASTPEGARDAALNNALIANGVIVSCVLHMVYRMLTAPIFVPDMVESFKAGWSGVAPSIVEHLSQETRFFGVLNQGRGRAFTALASAISQRFIEMNAPAGTADVLLPEGTLRLSDLMPLSQDNYKQYGDNAEARAEAGNRLSKVMAGEGFVAMELPRMRVAPNTAPACPLIFPRSVGTHTVIDFRHVPNANPLRARIAVPDWDNDGPSLLSLEDLITRCGIWDEAGNATGPYVNHLFGQTTSFHRFCLDNKLMRVQPDRGHVFVNNLLLGGARGADDANMHDNATIGQATFTEVDVAQANPTLMTRINSEVDAFAVAKQGLPADWLNLCKGALKNTLLGTALFTNFRTPRDLNTVRTYLRTPADTIWAASATMLAKSVKIFRTIAVTIHHNCYGKRDAQSVANYNIWVKLMQVISDAALIEASMNNVAIMRDLLNELDGQVNAKMLDNARIQTAIDNATRALNAIPPGDRSFNPTCERIMRKLPKDVTRDEYVDLIRGNVIFPIPLLFWRPHISFTMGTGIAVKRGSMCTIMGDPNVMTGQSAAIKKYTVHFSLYFAAHTKNPRGIVPLPNISAHRYMGGGGIRAWNPCSKVDIRAYGSHNYTRVYEPRSAFILPLFGTEEISGFSWLNMCGVPGTRGDMYNPVTPRLAGILCQTFNIHHHETGGQYIYGPNRYFGQVSEVNAFSCKEWSGIRQQPVGADPAIWQQTIPGTSWFPWVFYPNSRSQFTSSGSSMIAIDPLRDGVDMANMILSERSVRHA